MSIRYLLLPALALAACQPAAEPDAEPAPSDAATTPAPKLAAPQPSEAAASEGIDPRFAPPELTPEAERGEKGARNVLLSWAAAMENGAFDSARLLFGDRGAKSGQSAEEYAASYAAYEGITIALGDGDVEGAAGSLFYAVPVTLTARRLDGPARRDGTITVRRVNDVPGATADQLRWRIERLEWR